MKILIVYFFRDEVIKSNKIIKNFALIKMRASLNKKNSYLKLFVKFNKWKCSN